MPAIYDQRCSGQARRAIADPSNPLYGAGMNSGFAGGGVWAAWAGYPVGNPWRGLSVSTGLHLPGSPACSAWGLPESWASA